MSPLKPSTHSLVDSTILACVHCARSKAKCDRKVPCSRCRLKNLTCQSRVPLRGKGRLSTNNKLKPPPTTKNNENSGTVESEPVTCTIDRGTDTAPQPNTTGNGLYMNWSHSAIHKWPRNRPSSRLEAEQAVSLSRLLAVPRVDESYTLNLSSSNFMLETVGVLKESNFSVQTRAPPSTTQLPYLSEMSAWDLPFSMTPDMPPRLTNDGVDGLMDNCLSAPFSFSYLEGSLSDYDQLHTPEGCSLFHLDQISYS